MFWSQPRSFGEGISAQGFLRLESGDLTVNTNEEGHVMWVSTDEGKTWQPRGPVHKREVSVSSFPIHPSHWDTMIQLANGRLLYPWEISPRPKHLEMDYWDMSSYGIWKGQEYQVEGHHHVPEFYAATVAYSDNEGEAWTFPEGQHGRRPSTLIGWFDFQGIPNGMCGVTPIGEVTLAETTDGRILLFGRSTVGRIVHSYSSDGGETWSPVLPTELPSSGSPARLRRIPQTGDLLCVWNQVSHEEIRRGYRRGRLSVAISQDSGQTWGHFKTLELSEGLADVDRIPPEYPIQMLRAHQHVGQLPDGFAWFHYSNVCFAGDKVYIMYSRGWSELGNAEQVVKKGEQVLRIYPLEWLYQ